jgi:hypothetical protein
MYLAWISNVGNIAVNLFDRTVLDIHFFSQICASSVPISCKYLIEAR